VRAVAEICARLDGLPLAIELAAAQASVFPPQVILDRLSSKTPFALSGPRDLPPRHQTLDAAISWSYDLLEPGERAVFRWCGVFAGGFNSEAVEAVRSGVEPNVDAVSTLAQLVAKSLVRLVNQDAFPQRYALLETLRTFALDQLHDLGELGAAQRRHANYYVDLAESLQPRLRGEGMPAALEALAQDYANFRDVFRWSSETGDLSVGLRLAGALYRFWLVRGHLTEARQWLESALARESVVPPEVRAEALNAAGVLAGMQLDGQHAARLFEQSLELWAALSNKGRMAYAYLNLGLVAHNLGIFKAHRCRFGTLNSSSVKSEMTRVWVARLAAWVGLHVRAIIWRKPRRYSYAAWTCLQGPTTIGVPPTHFRTSAI
jgi:hypothetical protein